MDTFDTPLLPPAPLRWPGRPRWTGRLRAWWAGPVHGPDDRFLADSCDLADLERRLRRLERDGRPDPLWPAPR